MDFFNKKINLQKESAIEKEWKEAEDFFAAHENEVKFRKKATKGGRNKGHSFVKIEGKIYKLNNRTHTVFEPDIGQGAFGRAKKGIDREGNIVVVKVRGERTEAEKKQEKENLAPGVEEVLADQGYLLGQAKRAVQPGESGTVKVGGFPGEDAKKTSAKIYEVIKYLGPENLFQAKKGKSLEKNIIYTLHAMMAIESLHRKRLVHKDIKPQNFVVNEEGAHLTVLPVDFDFAELLPEKKDPSKKSFFSSWLPSLEADEKIRGDAVGTRRYMAPEAFRGEYSMASDVYALGIMLDGMLMGDAKKGELSAVVKRMTASEPEDRMPLLEAITAIKNYLEKKPQNDEIIKALKAFQDFTKKGTVYESTPINRTAVPAAQPIQAPKTAVASSPSVQFTKPSVPKSFLNKVIGGLIGKKTTEADKKEASEAHRDINKPLFLFNVEADTKKTMDLITYFTTNEEFVRLKNSSPPAVTGLIMATVESLRTCLDEKNRKDGGAPVLTSLKQLLTGLDVIDRNSKKQSDKTVINQLKNAVIDRAYIIEPKFSPPVAPTITVLTPKNK